MKKLIIVLTAVLFVLTAAGCAKQTGGEPASPQSTTLEAVSDEQAEITLNLELNTTVPAAAEQTDGTTKAGETRATPSATEPDAAKETTLPAAAEEGTTAAPDGTTVRSGSTAAAPDGSGQTPPVGGSTTAPAEATSLPSVHNQPRTTASTTTAAAGRTGGYELPAIPLK